jgi:hypothetical protein
MGVPDKSNKQWKKEDAKEKKKGGEEKVRIFNLRLHDL